MAFRLVASVKRSGSTQAYFPQRIPKAIRARAVGLKVAIAIGSEMIPLRITETMETVRVSLRTSDPSTAKVRMAEVAAYPRLAAVLAMVAKLDQRQFLSENAGLGHRADL